MGERLREILLYSDDHEDPRFWCNTYEVVFPVRGKRRHHRDRLKRKAHRFLLTVWKISPEDIDGTRIGHMFETHCRPCSCSMCRSDDAPRHNDRRRSLMTIGQELRLMEEEWREDFEELCAYDFDGDAFEDEIFNEVFGREW